MINRSNLWRYYLIIGDILTLTIVTVFGFASHGTAGTAGSRMLTTFIPLLAAWILIAPHLKVYDRDIALDGRLLPRQVPALVVAGPMAAWLRGVLLNSPILPVFVVILGGVSALAILTWRGLYWLVMTRMKRSDG